MIPFGEQQIDAINSIKSFISTNTSTAYSLIGSAGTGKTSIMLEIVKDLNIRNIDFVLCAPTHQAKLVLERITGESVITLHKLLSLSPNVEIEDLDLLNLEFVINEKTIGIPKNGIVICDEASMINDALFTKLVELCKERKTKILFLGDIKQLNPVKSNNTSLVFNLKDKYELTKIYRQKEDSALSEVLLELRNNSIIRFDQDIKSNGSLYTFNDPKDFLKKAIISFKKSNDILDCKLLAYTNDKVRLFNQVIKKHLFKNGNELNRNELLKGTDNFLYNNKIQLYNSLDYVITDVSDLQTIVIDNYFKMPGYIITIYDSVYKVYYDIPVLSKIYCKEEDLILLAFYIEDIRKNAINAKSKKQAGYLWKKYYSITGSFATFTHLKCEGRVVKKQTFDSGYAITIHKSQGSTYKEVFFDNQNINKYNLDESSKRQLQYVGISRTSDNVNILQ